MRTIVFDSQLRQAWGLMFQRPKPDTLYLFDFGKAMKTSFHMLFVFHPIDVFFLDKLKKVVEIKRNFKPFTVYFPKKSFHYAIETVPGLLQSKIGDVVKE